MCPSWLGVLAPPRHQAMVYGGYKREGGRMESFVDNLPATGGWSMLRVAERELIILTFGSSLCETPGDCAGQNATRRLG